MKRERGREESEGHLRNITFAQVKFQEHSFIVDCQIFLHGASPSEALTHG